MLKWALIFAVLAIVAAIFGFGGVAEGFATVAIVLFVVFLVIAIVLAIIGYKAVRKLT